MNKLYHKNGRWYNSIVMLMAFMTVLATTLNLQNFSERQIKKLETTGSIIERYILQMQYSINEYSILHFLLFIAIAYVYHLILRKSYGKKEKIVVGLIATLIGILNAIGYSFDKENSWDAIFSTKFGMFRAFLYAFGMGIAFYSILLCLYEIIIPKLADFETKKSCIRTEDGIKQIAAPSRKFKMNYLEGNKKTIIFVFLVIVIAWMPYYYGLYPGSLTWDAKDEIAQVLNDWQHAGTAQRLDLLNENVLLNTHHPVVYTLYLGIFVKLGQFIGNMNLGIGLFTLSQVLISAFIIASSVYFMAKLKFSQAIIKGTVVFFALFPMNPLWAMTVTKDYIFALMSLLCTMVFYTLMKKPHLYRNYKFMLFAVISLLGLQLTKSNGKYMVMFMLFFVFALKKQYKWRALATLILSWAIYSLLIVKVIFPAFDITQEGAKRAIMYLPEQQVVRCLVEHADEITEAEKEAISKVFKYKKGEEDKMQVLVSLYNPIRCTPVMKRYNSKATTKELTSFFKCWIGMLKKYPATCLEATFNQDYRIFYLAPVGNGYYTNVRENPYDIKEIESTKGYRDIVKSMVDMLMGLPILSIFFSTAFYTWMIVIALGYFIAKKQYENMVSMGFCIANILLSLIGPLIQIRYSIQWVICVPFIIGMVVAGAKEGQADHIMNHVAKQKKDKLTIL
ncbi:DUF6020 family protein [Lachnospiraceae bacterium ZAX-1]